MRPLLLLEMSSELMFSVDHKGRTASPLYFWPVLYRGPKECVRDVAKSARVVPIRACASVQAVRVCAGGTGAGRAAAADAPVKGMLAVLLALGGG